MKPYKGKRSILSQDYFGAYYTIPSYRGGFDPVRAPALREFGKHLIASDIYIAAGPVLSGALLAQQVSDLTMGRVQAQFLPKPGYAAARHSNTLPKITKPWVFVDDICSSGNSIRYSTKNDSIMRPPEAIVMFKNLSVYEDGTDLGWDVPIYVLYGRV